MQTVINALRDILGQPDFYKVMTTSGNYSWDYGSMIEYLVGAMIVMLCLSYVFKFIKWAFMR